VLHLVRPLRRAVGVLLSVAVLGSLASQAWMAYGSLDGWSTTRLYFGTDTHAMSVMVGGSLALAFVWLRGRTYRKPPWQSLGLAAALGVGLAMVTVAGGTAWLYRFGFLAFALLTAVMLAAVRTRPGSTLSTALSVRPLAWIGLISYGIYLWHFPVWVALTPARVHLSGYELAAVQLALSVGIAAISYYTVERPIIRGTFWRSVRALPVAVVGTAGTVALIAALTIAPLVGPASAVERFRPVTRVPSQVVILGDSTALTLGVALKASAPAGVQVVNAALWGCGLSIAESTGLTRVAPCNQSTPVSGQWPALDARAVASTGPGDQVLFLAGHWETGDTTFADGEIQDIGEPVFQRYEARQLDTLYEVATAHGAHLDLLTMAAMDGDYAYGTPVAATDSAARRADYNRLLADLAAEHPDQVSLIPYGEILSPSGTFQLTVDGVQVRTPDGIHTPAYVPGNPFAGDTDDAGMADRFYGWIGLRLWPLIISPTGIR